MVSYSNDEEVLVDCIWIVSYLTENYKKSLKVLIEAGMVPKVVQVLS